MSLKLLYVLMGGAGALPLPPSELLHLNQAGVQHLICDLTDTHSGTLGHSHKGAAGSIPAVIERKRKRALGLRMPLPLP